MEDEGTTDFKETCYLGHENDIRHTPQNKSTLT